MPPPARSDTAAPGVLDAQRRWRTWRHDADVAAIAWWVNEPADSCPAHAATVRS